MNYEAGFKEICAKNSAGMVSFGASKDCRGVVLASIGKNGGDWSDRDKWEVNHSKFDRKDFRRSV